MSGFSKTFGTAAVEIRCIIGEPETAQKRIHKGSVVIVHAMDEDGDKGDVDRHFEDLAAALEEYAAAVRRSGQRGDAN